MANVTVNFTTNICTTDPLGAGFVCSEFGGNPIPIVGDSTWRAALTTLAPGHVRFSLGWYGGNPSYAAGGSPRKQGSGGSTATNLINVVKTMGAIPLVSFNGDSSDNGMNSADGGNLVHFFNDNGGQRGGRIQYWSIGNEADNGGGTAAYESVAPGILSAMHAADSTINVGMPAAAYWNTGFISWAAGRSGIGTLSYHAYDGASNFPNDGEYYTHVKNDLPGYKGGILYGVEECNWNPAYNNDGRFYDWHNAVFIADATGQVLSAGGHMSIYSDSNGALGLLNDGSGGTNQPGGKYTKFPAYWGLGIWTGMNGQFKRYGTHFVSCSNTLGVSTLGTFACDNGKLVIVNKSSSSQTLTIGVTMAAGATSSTYNIFATQASNPLSPITEVVTNATFTGSTINYTIPASTAVSIDINLAGSGGGGGGGGGGGTSPGTLTQPGGVPADQFLVGSAGPYLFQLNEWNTTQAYSCTYSYTAPTVPPINAPPVPAGYNQSYYHDFTTGGIGDWTPAGDPGGIGGVSGNSTYAVTSNGLGVTLTSQGDTIGLWSPSAQVVPHSFIQAYVYLPYTSGQIANWPDFWCVGPAGTANNSPDGEIDLCEGLGGQVCWHTHSTPGSPGGGATLGTYLGWHYYSCLWNNNSVTFWYDNVQVASGVSLATTKTMTLQFGTSAETAGGLTPWGSTWYGGPALLPSTAYLAWAGIWK